MNYRCPICHAPLLPVEKSLICEHRHCFDFAKSGYVNLLCGKNSSRSHGDNRQMVDARRRFLESGAYHCLAEQVSSLLQRKQPAVLVDAGCGEGSYTRQIKQACPNTEVLGFDLSKEAILYASRKDQNSRYAISSIFALPLFDASVDAVVSIFAPIALDEFSRILRPQGFLLTVTPGPRHLLELKQQLYEHPYFNESFTLQDSRFQLEQQKLLEDQILLPTQESIQDLFTMTPYFYTTAKDGKEKLKALTSFSTRIEFQIQLWRKN